MQILVLTVVVDIVQNVFLSQKMCEVNQSMGYDVARCALLMMGEVLWDPCLQYMDL